MEMVGFQTKEEVAGESWAVAEAQKHAATAVHCAGDAVGDVAGAQMGAKAGEKGGAWQNAREGAAGGELGARAARAAQSGLYRVHWNLSRGLQGGSADRTPLPPTTRYRSIRYHRCLRGSLTA